MKKSKDEILSFVRSLLTAIGAFLAGKVFLGTEINEQTWLGITGAVVALAAIIWGIVDKTLELEMFQSGLKSVIIVAGGLLVSSRIIDDKTLLNILGLVTIIAPMLYSWLNKKKAQNIASGKSPISQLSGVDEKAPSMINPKK